MQQRVCALVNLDTPVPVTVERVIVERVTVCNKGGDDGDATKKDSEQVQGMSRHRNVPGTVGEGSGHFLDLAEAAGGRRERLSGAGYPPSIGCWRAGTDLISTGRYFGRRAWQYRRPTAIGLSGEGIAHGAAARMGRTPQCVPVWHVHYVAWRDGVGDVLRPPHVVAHTAHGHYRIQGNRGVLERCAEWAGYRSRHVTKGDLGFSSTHKRWPTAGLAQPMWVWTDCCGVGNGVGCGCVRPSLMMYGSGCSAAGVAAVRRLELGAACEHEPA
eukprot:scaffold8530_cov121-Isochrysis_galbana.AAC.3